MYSENRQPEPVRRVIVDQKGSAPSAQTQAQSQFQQMQQMQAQMAQMQEQLARQQQAQQQPQYKTYSLGQVQIMLACETINNVMEEFELSQMKKSRLIMARDFLLDLGDLSEFITRPETRQSKGQTPEQQIPDEELFEETQEQQEPEGMVEKYPGQQDKTMTEEIDKINQKMEELKKVGAKETKEKAMSGLDRIKSFISKKNVPAEEPIKDNFDQYKGVAEGMG